MAENQPTKKPHTYAVWGMHGGYFLTSKVHLERAIRYTKDVLKERPDLAYSIEFEAFTLDRLARGPQLRVEEKHCEGQWQDEELLGFFQKAAREKRIDNVSTYTQPILHALDGEAVVRQFGYARRIQRDTLGIELDYYAAQEPCWCGQIPAILRGFNMKGCSFETSWGPFGFAPLKNGESFRWRGPDGSEIRTVTATPAMRAPKLERDKETARHFLPWQNPFYEKLNAASIAEAHKQGLDHPMVQCLSLDFTGEYPPEPFDPARLARDDCNVTFTTLGPYLEVARDDGVWEDAFAEFEDRMNWGMEGGKVYLHSQVAANRTILAQRLSVLLGFDHRDEEYKLWQATMVSHHHDCWLVPNFMFGHFRYDSYGDLIAACREEVEERAAKLFRVAEGPEFCVTNPTQRTREEWIQIDLRLREGEIDDEPAIQDAEGHSVANRLRVLEQHADGTAARVQGFMLADVDGFASAPYSVGELSAPMKLPTEAVKQENGWKITNCRLDAVVSTDGIRLYCDDIEYVSDLYLHAEVERWDQRCTIRSVDAMLEESGAAYACARGVLGSIPFEIEIRIRPWTDRFDIHVRCDYAGETTEGANYWEQEGNLKLVAAYPQPVSHSLHHPFELREPSRNIHSAVHFVLADRTDGGGCALILDRPTGVVSGESSTGITLCHSGWSIFHGSVRPGVKGIDGQRFSRGRVHGLKDYDVSLLPYAPEDRAVAAAAYQHQAYPLQITSGHSGPLPVPRIRVDGHSVVSNLSREENGIVLRFWNPFEKEDFAIEAPGMQLTLVDLEGTELERLGKDAATLSMGPMQIRSVLLTPRTEEISE